MMWRVAVAVSCMCMLVAGEGTSQLGAKPECAGEIRLTISHPQQGQHVVKREAMTNVVGVGYKTPDADTELYKEFAGSDSQVKAYSAVIRGLEPGNQYQLRVRHGQRSADSVTWGEYGDYVTANSGTVQVEDGPSGVGEGVRGVCSQSRRRASGVPRPHSDRLHRATFASSGRRRRGAYVYVPTYSYVYVPTYSNTYYYYTYYCYYNCGSTSIGGAVAGAIIGFIFIVAAITICCKFYLYGGCGRTAYRQQRFNGRNTTTVVTNTTGVSAANPQFAMTGTANVVQPAYPGSYTPAGPYANQAPQTAQPAGAGASGQATMESKPAYPNAPNPAQPAYPAPPQGAVGAAPAWSGVAQPLQPGQAYPPQVQPGQAYPPQAAPAQAYPPQAYGGSAAPPSYGDLIKQ